jgi:G3E family GTPase
MMLTAQFRGDLAAALEQLVQRKETFQYIFIETTGLADPGPLANSLWLDEQLESSIYLDAIVTIVDAKHFRQNLDMVKPDNSVNEAQRQVRFRRNLLNVASPAHLPIP